MRQRFLVAALAAVCLSVGVARADEPPAPRANPPDAPTAPETPAAPDAARADAPTKPEAKAEEAKHDDGKPAEAKAATPKGDAPKTAVAARGPFTVLLDATGVFDATGGVEVRYEPEAYGGELEVVEAFRGGAVTAGQVLVRFATAKIDEQLEALGRDVEIGRRTLLRQQEEAKKSKEVSDAALERATLERDRAARALKRFVETERAMRTQESTLRLKGTADAIADQEEEYQQLVDMYGAGDAVEKTEQIVLNRTKRGLERMKIGYEFQKSRHQWFVDVELADDQRGLELAARKEALDVERAKATADLALEQSRLELARAEANFGKQEKALADLKKDRDALTLTAPRAGLAVPGACVRGKWQGTEETWKELERGGHLRAKVPVFTIVDAGATAVRTLVGEGRVLSVRPGQPVEVKPTSDETRALAGTVATVSPVAGEGGYLVTVDLKDRDPRLLAGFTAKLRIRTREAKDVVTVPVASVGTDGEARYVSLVDAAGATSRRVVRLGDTSDGRVEVVEGLGGGEHVLESPAK